jgi:hypothetical protein
VLPQARVILGVTCNVIRNELTQNDNVVGATRDRCTHATLGDGRYFGAFSTGGKATSAQGSPKADPSGAIPGVFLLAQRPFRP